MAAINPTKPLAQILASIGQGYTINPQAYARAAAANQYNPVINSTQAQITQSAKDHAANLSSLDDWLAGQTKKLNGRKTADLTNIDNAIDSTKTFADDRFKTILGNLDKWYGNLANVQATATKNDQSAGASALSGYDDAAKGFLSAIGGEAAPGAGVLAGSAALGHGGLAGQNLAQAQFDNAMPAAIAEMKTRDKSSSQSMMDQALMNVQGDALGKRTDLLRGYQDTVSGMEDKVTQGRLDENNRFGDLSSNLAASLLSAKQGKASGYQTALGDATKMRSDMDAQKQSLAIAAAQAIPGIQSQLLQNTNLKLQNDAARKQIHAMGQDWDGMSQVQRTKAITDIGSQFNGAGGGLNTDPVSAWKTVTAQLTAAGWSPKAARTAAQGVMASVVHRWNTSHSKDDQVRYEIGPEGKPRPERKSSDPKKKSKPSSPSPTEKALERPYITH